MGDLPADVTVDDARASVCSKHDLYVHLFVLARLLICMRRPLVHMYIYIYAGNFCRPVCRLVVDLFVDLFVDLL